MRGERAQSGAEETEGSAVKLRGLDIGKPTLRGSTARLKDGYEVAAGGADIWHSSDQFHFAFCTIGNDFDFSARISFFSMADDYSKAGIMARESLSPGSRHVYVLAFGDNRPRNSNNGGFELQYRKLEDSASSAIYPPNHTTQPPLYPVRFPETWIRLRRKGYHFDSFCALSDGVWKHYASLDLPISEKIYLGLAVTSHNVEQAVTARFNDLVLRREIG